MTNHKPKSRIDRSAVMKRAWKDFRYWRKAGEPRTFGDCLRGAWAVARLARDTGSHKFQLATMAHVARGEQQGRAAR